MNLSQKIRLSAVLLVTTCSVIGTQAAHAFDRDNPPPQPFSAECHIDVLDIVGMADCGLPAVPAGKRWVIETVTGSLELPKGIKPALIDFHITTGGVETDNVFPAKFQGTSVFYPGDFFTINEQVRLYQDGNTGPFFSLALTDNAPAATGFLTVAGYLVDMH
jgi:hypothetical protein